LKALLPTRARWRGRLMVDGSDQVANMSSSVAIAVLDGRQPLHVRFG